MSKKAVAKKPENLLDSFQKLSMESGIGLSIMVNHYRDGTVEFNIEFDKELYKDGVPLNTVVGLLNHATGLIISQSTNETATEGDTNES